MQTHLRTLSEGRSLSREEARAAMDAMLEGTARPEHVAALLLGLRSRGETVEELAGFTLAMREHMVQVDAGDPQAIDLCGTGGDASGTFNISTAAALAAAGAGATVAKHGNRSVSSKSGSADVLEALGVQVALGKEGVEHCLRQAGVAFLFAPYFHPAMRHVMPVRKTLGVRTAFNILGPLCNPAGVKRQLVGAFSAEVAQQMADILAATGSEAVVTVHSADGLDEFSISAPTMVFRRDGQRDLDASHPGAASVSPEDFGLGRAPLKALRGGTAEDNAAILRRILDGEHGPARDVVVLNAAHALLVSGRHGDDLGACFEALHTALDTGAARHKLEALVDASQSAPTA